MNYPTTLTAQNAFAIAQISDLHLSAHSPTNTDKFLAVLGLAQRHNPDLLLLTGDLVNDGDTALYDWLFDTLHDTSIPFLCLAGNHDTTHETNHHLPFHQRQFLPIKADNRLINHHRLIIKMPDTAWQILTVNSAVGGQIYGNISDDGLAFLTHYLKNPTPTIIAMHHHPLPVGSAWIDELMLANHDEFWQIVHPCSHVRAVLSGHVHQSYAFDIPKMTNCTFYATPATARQFLPFNDHFALDTMTDGFRLIVLNDDDTLITQVLRLP